MRPLLRTVKDELEEAAALYEDYLWDPDEDHGALEYLMEERGFTEDTIKKFRLGYVAEAHDVSHAKMVGRIAIPYLSTTGPVKLRFRRVGDGEGAKFLDLPGAIPRLYNVKSLAGHPNGDTAYITEGEPDTIIASQIGLGPVVGLPGVTSWQDRYEKLLEGYETLVILCDADDKGQGEEMGNQLATLLKGHNVRIVLAPDGHDLNSAFLEGGGENLLAWIRGEFD